MFERAEALNAVIQNNIAESHARQAAVADLRTSVKLLELTFAQERADCVNNILRAANSLRASREQLEVALSQQLASTERQWDLENSRIRGELERIALEKGHFEREEQALTGDSERTEEAIRTQTGDLAEKKEGLESAMDALNEEIRALQEQLALKLAAQLLLSSDLKQVDGKIGEVRKKYDRQLQRISDRQEALQQSKAECLDEESAVLREQALLEAQAADSKTSKQQSSLWACSLAADVEIAEVLLSRLKSSSGGSGDTQIASIGATEAAADDASSAELKRNQEAILYLLNKKRALITELHAHRDSLICESKRLADLLPVFDAEKKACAAGKRFKEAAAAAKELKEAQTAKEAIDADVERTDGALATASSEIAQLEDQEVVVSNAIRDARRKSDISRFEALILRASEVRAMRRLVKRTQRRLAKQNGAMVVHGIGESVFLFLSAELEAVRREGQVLRELHSLPEEVVVSEEEEEDDDEEEKEEEELGVEKDAPDDSSAAAAVLRPPAVDGVDDAAVDESQSYVGAAETADDNAPGSVLDSDGEEEVTDIAPHETECEAAPSEFGEPVDLSPLGTHDAAGEAVDEVVLPAPDDAAAEPSAADLAAAREERVLQAKVTFVKSYLR